MARRRRDGGWIPDTRFEVEAVYRRPTRVEAVGPRGGRVAVRDHVMLAKILALALLVIVTYERRLR